MAEEKPTLKDMNATLDRMEDGLRKLAIAGFEAVLHEKTLRERMVVWDMKNRILAIVSGDGVSGDEELGRLALQAATLNYTEQEEH